MIEAHTLDAWTRAADRESIGFRNATILGGFAAPLFLWLAGLASVLSATRTAEKSGSRIAALEAICRRGLEIFILAYLFRLQAFVVSPGSHPITIFRIDILNIMGPAIAGAGMIWWAATSRRSQVTAFAVVAAAIAMATPLVRETTIVNALPIWVQWYIRPAGEHTTFTGFPWVGFVFAGAACGSVLAAAERVDERRVHIGLALTGAALVAFGFYASALPTIYARSSFWTSSPTWFAIRLGILQLALSAFFLVEQVMSRESWRRAQSGSRVARLALFWHRPLETLGRNSLFVYWIHVELVYGYASWLWRRRLPLWGTALGWLAFSVGMYWLVILSTDFRDGRRIGSGNGRRSRARATRVGNTHAAAAGGLMNRRDFARLIAIGGAAPFLTPSVAWPKSSDLPPTPAVPDERFWSAVRDQFVMPRELTMLNAANLCPSSAPVLELLYKTTRDIDQDPSQDNRAKLGDGRENTRKLLAEFLRVTPEEIVITRNTSESNNLVSTGLDLKAGDEVLLSSDNHPSNHTAWQEKAKRFGFTVKDLPTPNPHPGFDYYVDAFTKAITPQTRLIGITHLTSTVGDLFPAKEICRMARERGVLTLVDGAQTFGLLDVDLATCSPISTAAARTNGRVDPRKTASSTSTRARRRRYGRAFQRVSRSRRRIAHLRRIRSTRRAGDDRVRRSAHVANEDRPPSDREEIARAHDRALRRREDDSRREGLDERGSVASRGGSLRSSRRVWIPTNCRPRCIRRIGLAARRGAARIAPACGSLRISTTRTPISIAR